MVLRGSVAALAISICSCVGLIKMAGCTVQGAMSIGHDEIIMGLMTAFAGLKINHCWFAGLVVNHTRMAINTEHILLHVPSMLGFDLNPKKRVSALSRAHQQMVEIAKALLHEPRLLLLDEPSSGLDPGARHGLWSLLEELRREKKVTILLTTHFMEEADRCDQLVLLDSGKIVGSGSPLDLKNEIGGDVITVVSGDPKMLASVLESQFGLISERRQNELRLSHPEAHKFVGDLAERYSDLIASVTVSRPSLEDVFIRRTGRSLEEETE